MKSLMTNRYVQVAFFIVLVGFMALQVYADQGFLLRFKVLEVQIPKYFHPVQWNPDGWIYGVMSDRFLKFNLATGEWKVLQSNVWSGVVDERGKVLAFRNEKGLYYVDLTRGGETGLVDSDPRMTLHFWSPDGRYLFYSRPGKWASEYYLYDRMRDVSRPYVFANVENFLSEPIAWKRFNGADRILFLVRFSRSQTGESAYRSTGYRGEFHLAALDGRLTPLFQGKDGEFPVYDGFSADLTRVYYHFSHQKSQIWEFDLLTGKSIPRWTLDLAKRMSLAADRNAGLVERKSLELVNLRKGETMHTFSYEYDRMIWSADHARALILPSIDSRVTKAYLLSLQ